MFNMDDKMSGRGRVTVPIPVTDSRQAPGLDKSSAKRQTIPRRV